MSINKRTFLLFFVVVITLVMTMNVFAGTLVSGSTVAISSNNPDISGKYTLVGLWSTTPTANDKIFITNAILPEPYGIKQQVAIDVPMPTFEQVFSVESQKPLYEYSLFESEMYVNSNCESKVSTEFNTKHPGAQRLVSNTAWYEVSNPLFCKGFIIYASNQKGWIGQTINKGINYNQKINIDGVGTLSLVRNEAEDKLADSISGVAIARVLGFSSWTNGLLDSRNTYAYHANVDRTVGVWSPFNDNAQYYTEYVVASSDLKNVYQSADATGLKISGEVRERFNNAINTNNRQVMQLVSYSTNYPSDWANKGFASQTRTVGNDIVVPLQRTALTANIQLILNGEKIGIFIPTGVPSIVSYDNQITFDETASGKVNYVVKNTGQSAGAFRVQLFCADSSIVGEADDLTMSAGQSITGNIRVTGKSSTTSDFSQTCKLQMKEVTTNVTVEKNVDVTVLAKSSCVVGQQSEPYTSGSLTIVDTLDAKCAVVSQIKCVTASEDVKLIDGKYQCVAKPQKDGGTGTFNTTLFTTSVILGLIGVAFAYTPVKEFVMPMGKYGKYVSYAILISIFATIALWLVPMVWKALLGLYGI